MQKIVCANCSRNIGNGEKYIPAYDHNIWFVIEHPKPCRIERELIKAKAICWKCLEEIATHNEG